MFVTLMPCLYVLLCGPKIRNKDSCILYLAPRAVTIQLSSHQPLLIHIDHIASFCVSYPLSYRGIALASLVYKIYCSVINERLSRWVEDNDKVTDEQNGVRRQRSTIHHVSSLTSLIETRKKLKKSTFCAFIDFKKA